MSKLQNQWSASALQLLVDYVSSNKIQKRINWSKINDVLPLFTKQQCQVKYRQYCSSSLRIKLAKNNSINKLQNISQKSFSFSSVLIFDDLEQSPIEQSDITITFPDKTMM